MTRHRRRLVAINVVAEYLNLTEGQVRGRVERRTIPFVKVGRSLRFDLEAIDEWLDANTHEAAS